MASVHIKSLSSPAVHISSEKSSRKHKGATLHRPAPTAAAAAAPADRSKYNQHPHSRHTNRPHSFSQCSSFVAGAAAVTFSAAAPRQRTSRGSSSTSSTVCRAGASAAGASAGDQGCPSFAAGLYAGLVQLLQAHFLPLALLSALLLGVTFPQLGLAAANLQIPTFTTFGIFIIQGLQLRRKEAAAALSATGAITYGLLSILLITPLMGLLAVQLPLQPPALALGLGVFCAMPTALSSGITFTQQLGGNVSLALLLTVSSNILGIFTMPFILPHIIAAAPLAATGAAGMPGSPVLEPLPLLLQLCKTILVPTMIGAAIRGFVSGAAGAIDARKKLLSYLSAALLALVPWMQISKTASQNIGVDALAVAATAVAGLAIHAAFLTLNATMCWLLRLGGPDPTRSRDVRRAVLLVSSVKTLPVAVTVLGKLAPVLGEAAVGVAVVPCVLAHLGQIVWDSLMVSKMKQQDEAAAAAAAAYGSKKDQ